MTTRQRAAGVGLAWLSLLAPVLYGGRGLLGRAAVCRLDPLSGADPGIRALFELFAAAGCRLFELGPGAVILFNALLLLPLAGLLGFAARSRGELLAHAGVACAYLAAMPQWFHVHRVEGLTTIVSYLLTLWLLRVCRVGERVSWGRVVAPALTFGLVLGIHYSGRQPAIAIPVASLVLTVALQATGWVGRGLFSVRRFAGIGAAVVALALGYHSALGAVTSRVLEQGVQPHTAGAPMLAGLGWADNPFNLVWDDDFLAVQIGPMLGSDRDLRNWYASAEVFQGFFFEVVGARPELLLHAVVAKARYLLAFLAFPDTPALYNPVQPSRGLGLVLFAFLLDAAGRLLLVRRPSPASAETSLALLPLFGATLVTPLLVAPTHLTPLLAFAGIWVARTVEQLTHRPPVTPWQGVDRPPALALGRVGLLAAVMIGGVALDAGLAAWRARSAAAALADVRARDFADYRQMAHFNSLREPERRALRAALAEQPGVRSSPDGDTLAFALADRVCVVLTLSEELAPAPPSRLQGPRNHGLLVLRGSQAFPKRVGPFEARFPFARIGDAAWTGQTKMVCLASPRGAIRGASALRVEIVRFVSGEHGLPSGMGIASVHSQPLR